MEIGATKAVQDRLKTTKIEESKGASLVFCWDTHLTKIKGRNKIWFQWVKLILDTGHLMMQFL